MLKQWKLYIISLATLLAISCSGRANIGDVVVSNAEYTVTGDSVVQGEYVAYAPSRTEIVTNYVDTLVAMPTSPVAARLAFNMRDNELPSGSVHFIDVSQDTVYISACRPDTLKSQVRRKINPDTHCTIIADLRNVTEAFKTKGKYVTAVGNTIYADEFNGVWLIGAVAPLSWELLPLSSNNRTKFRPTKEEGIYELDVDFAPTEFLRRSQFSGWKAEKTHEEYPQFESSDLLVDAIYNMSISAIAEADYSELNVSQASLAAIMSLADIRPQLCEKMLRSMVHGGVVEQDHIGRFTFPIVNDRFVWAAAAWQVYCATGSSAWLKYARKVIMNTLDEVNSVAFCDQLYMVHGCDGYSSPEFQYPRWMQPKDYFESIKLSNNVSYAYCYYVLSLMDEELEENGDEHFAMYQRIKDSINQTMWNERTGRYCSYLLHEAFPLQSGVTSNIAQAAAILFGIADDDRASTLLACTPMYNTGIPSIYPSSYSDLQGDQRQFVQGMWNMAAARCGNMTVFHHGLAALYRSVAFMGFAISAKTSGERVLNACAAASMTLKLTAGITLSPEGIEFNPVVPECFPSDKTINNFKYRGAIFDITIHGTGSRVGKFLLDEKELNGNFIGSDIKGRHKVDITLTEGPKTSQDINLSTPVLRPYTPEVTWQGDSAAITNFENDCHYSATINTHTFSGIHKVFAVPHTDQFMNVVYVTSRRHGAQSHASRPHFVIAQSAVTEYPLCKFAKPGTNMIKGSEAQSVVELHSGGVEEIVVDAFAASSGEYYLDLQYSNGASTVSVTPIGKICVNTHPQDVIVFPQRGVGQWRTFGYSNMIKVSLLKGRNTIRMQYGIVGNVKAVKEKPVVLLRTMRLIRNG